MTAVNRPNGFDTHYFDLLKESRGFFFFLVLSSLLFSHIGKPLRHIIFVPLTELMIPNASRIIWQVDLAEVTPFVTLANPVLQQTDNPKNSKFDN